MKSFLKVNNVWQDLTKAQFKVNGAWHKPKKLWMKLNGVWVQMTNAQEPTFVTLRRSSFANSVPSPKLTFVSDGNCLSDAGEPWLSAPEVGAGSNYWIRIPTYTGNITAISRGTYNTWMQMDSNLTLTLINSGSFRTSSGNYYISTNVSGIPLLGVGSWEIEWKA